MMRGLEVGRVQVAARAVGVAQAALADALANAQERESIGKPIWQHQLVGNLLADMATKVQASRLMTVDAAERLDSESRAGGHESRYGQGSVAEVTGATFVQR